jgi:hypothetical protein
MGRLKETAQPEANLREIAAWSRRYAQNRTVPVLVGLLVFVVVAVAIGGSSYFAGWVFLAGHRAWAPLAVALLALALALQAWLISRHSQRFIQRISDRVYQSEGQASLQVCGTPRRGDKVIPLAFVLCVTVSVGLGLAGTLPLHYMQPISAIYFVPFLILLSHRFRGAISPFAHLWPGLYALHAVLLLLGVPIYFSGRLETLNMLLPTIGYGLVAALAGHIYSRFALRKLRRLAAVAPEEGE